MTHGEIWWVDFGIPIGSLPAYRRPVIIMQNELGSDYSSNGAC